MSLRLRRTILGALLLAAAALAWAPLSGAGPLGEDLPTLIAIAELRDDGIQLGELHTVPGIVGEPLAAASLALGHWIASPDGRWTKTAVRAVWIGNGLALLLAAWALARVVRRGFEPWAGRDEARAAGVAGGILLVAHPLSVVSVARVASRGDLIAVALGLASLAVLLHGRQRGRYGLVAWAGVLALAAGTASRLAGFLPLVAAALEYASARRHRGRVVRLRTASNTLFVFTACVVLGSASRHAFPAAGAEQPWRAASPFDVAALEPEGALSTLLFGLEKLGVLVLPVNTQVLGAVGYVLAALAFLAALHPAILAGRSAPRTWGWILVSWLIATVVCQWPDRHQRVQPQTLEHAHVLLLAAVVMAAGLGIASTALSGVRRWGVPLAVATLYSMLSHVVALPREDAGQALESLAVDLARAVEQHGTDVHYVVLDPPRRVEGVPLFGASLADLGEPCLRARLGGVEQRDPEPLSLLGIESASVPVWVRQPEFARLREEGLVWLVPRDLVPGADVHEPQGEGPVVLRVPAAEASTGRFNWRGEGRSPNAMQLDSFDMRGVAVEGVPGRPSDTPPVLRWSARSPLASEGAVTGAWTGTPAEPVATFDLGSSLTWLLGERVRAVWFTGELASLSFAQVLPDVPPMERVPGPVREGDDWVFELGGVQVPEALVGEASWALVLFDVPTGQRLELVVSSEGAPGITVASRLRVPEADLRARRACERTGGPVAWTLERRVGDTCVARSSGRVRESPPSKL